MTCTGKPFVLCQLLHYCNCAILAIMQPHLPKCTLADINECDMSPCDSNATCTNTPGSFMCACNSGYIGDGMTCTGEHFVLCQLLHYCNCAILAIMQFHLPKCTLSDINECDMSPCDPDATCTNTLGSFVCACNSGYIGDGMTCTGKLSCFANFCITVIVPYLQ